MEDKKQSAGDGHLECIKKLSKLMSESSHTSQQNIYGGALGASQMSARDQVYLQKLQTQAAQYQQDRMDALNRAGQQLAAQSNANSLAQQYNGYNAILPQNEPKPGMVVRITADGKGYEWANPADPGALPAKWTEAPSNTTETTENPPIVDIMAITRGMCK